MEGTDYYLGTYSTFNTISASKLSYISAENTGVSQFPASLYTLVLKEVAPVSKNEPAADTAYKFAVNQVTLGGVLYVTGEVDGRYLATTDKISEAADVYAEVVEGGYKFYILVEGAKQYITVYNNESGKLSVKYDAAGTSVYAYNATVNAWVTNMEGTDYYLGTYNNFNTISASKLSYISAENTGVSQFPANIVAIEFVTEGGDDVTPPEGGDDVTPPEGGDTATLPADGSTLTAAQALALNKILASGGTSTEKYYISGTITEFYGSGGLTFGNVYIKDAEGNTILIYGLVDADGKKYSEMTTKPVIGDTITVYGVINNYKGTIQFKDATVTAHTAHECAMSEATCKAPATCSICGKTEGDVLDHVYVDGVCSGCGAAEPSGDQTTVSKTMGDIATANGWADSTLYASFDLDDSITVSSSGTPVGSYGLNTGKYYASSTTWRIYQNESPAVTITADEGKTIISVKITYSVKNSGTLTLDGANIASGTVVSVNANSVTFSVGNTGTATNGQAQITAIEVIYQ